MNIYEDYLNRLDNEILELLTLRKEFKINAKNFKVLELGGYNIEDTYISKLDDEIFKYESKNINDLYKLFNENLKSSEIYEELNLSRLIKYSYINFLYDYCIYGDDENYELTCKLDRDILIKLSKRVHFGYNIIKLNYLENTNFYNKLLESNNSTFILYYLSNYISQPTYLELLKDKCNKYKICDILICTFYKTIILPYYNEIQLHFCNCIKKTL